MNDEKILRLMRNQSWQRAKAEIFNTLVTHSQNREKYEAMTMIFAEFVSKIEAANLVEFP